MREDLAQLVGKPVLELYAEKRAENLRRHSTLRDKVYIPIEGVRRAEDGKFEVRGDNPAFDLMQEVEKKFLMNSEKSVLLLAGPAGESACVCFAPCLRTHSNRLGEIHLHDGARAAHRDDASRAL